MTTAALPNEITTLILLLAKNPVAARVCKLWKKLMNTRDRLYWILCSPETAEMALKHGFFLHLTSNYILAAQYGFLDTIKWLRQRHEKISADSLGARTNWSSAVVLEAAKAGNYTLVRWLVDNNCPYRIKEIVAVSSPQIGKFLLSK